MFKLYRFEAGMYVYGCADDAQQKFLYYVCYFFLVFTKRMIRKV
jgi:hypothetical protein